MPILSASKRFIALMCASSFANLSERTSRTNKAKLLLPALFCGVGLSVTSLIATSHTAYATILQPYTNYDGQNLSAGDYTSQDGSFSSFIGTVFDSSILTNTNLSNANMRNAHFVGANLTNTYFSGTNLSGADFYQSYISSMQLRFASNIQGANLGGHDFTNFDLHELDMRNVALDGNTLTGTDFSGTNLNGARLHWSNISSAQLHVASDVRGIIFENSNLTDYDLHSLNLTQGNFNGANVRNANFSGTDLSGTNFASSNISADQLRSASNAQQMDLSFITLSDSDLSNVNLTDANLQSAELTNTNLSGATLNNVNLIGANLNGSNISSLQLRTASNVQSVRLYRSNLSGYDLHDVNLTGANLRYATFADANLTGANLTSTDLRQTDLSLTDLSSTNLSGAYLDRTILPTNMSTLPVNSGARVTVSEGRTVNALNGTDINAGLLQVDGTLNTTNATLSGIINYSPSRINIGTDGNLVCSGQINLFSQGSTVSGNGTITGNVNNLWGTVAPGDSPGTLTIQGNYTQFIGDYAIDIASLLSYDVLNVSGTATFQGGRFVVALMGDYIPNIGDTFTVLTTGNGLTGTDLVYLSPGWTFIQNGNNGILRYSGATTVPETGTLVMILIGGLGLVRCYHNRKR